MAATNRIERDEGEAAGGEGRDEMDKALKAFVLLNFIYLYNLLF